MTPIRAMLEDGQAQGATVVLRARSERELPLLDEIRELARSREAKVIELWGQRSEGWLPDDAPASFGGIVRDPAVTDVFVCGPEEWVAQVTAEAREHGVPESQIHTEKYRW